MMVERSCVTCGEEYQPTNGAQRYCSEECKPRCQNHPKRRAIAEGLCPTCYSRLWRGEHPERAREIRNVQMARARDLARERLGDVEYRRRQAMAKRRQRGTPLDAPPYEPVKNPEGRETVLSPRTTAIPKGSGCQGGSNSRAWRS